MAYYIYIIQSKRDGTFYKGYSENPVQRLMQHNNGESQYTSTKTPWELVYIEEMCSKREALVREKNLKKATTERINALLTHAKNIVNRFKE